MTSHTHSKTSIATILTKHQVSDNYLFGQDLLTLQNSKNSENDHVGHLVLSTKSTEFTVWHSVMYLIKIQNRNFQIFEELIVFIGFTFFSQWKKVCKMVHYRFTWLVHFVKLVVFKFLKWSSTISVQTFIFRLLGVLHCGSIVVIPSSQKNQTFFQSYEAMMSEFVWVWKQIN